MRLTWGHLVLGGLSGAALGGLLILLLEGQSPITERVQRQIRYPVEKVQAHTYPFLINHPEKCTGNLASPFLLMLVMTKPQEAGRRQAIRRTWGHRAVVPGVDIRLVFLMGLPPFLPLTPLWNMLVDEDWRHNDLLQVGLLDTHHNLTLKTLMGLEWVAHYCPTAHYVLKVKSNVFVNPSFLVKKVLPSNGPQLKNFITGYIYRNVEPNRIPRSGEIPKEVSPQTRYPPYCSGFGYVMSSDLVIRVLAVAPDVKNIYPEEVFVGLCLKRLGVEPTHSLPNSFQQYRIRFHQCNYLHYALINDFLPQELLQYWSTFQKANSTCPQD